MSKRGEALIENKMRAHLYLPFFRHLGSLLYHSTSLLLVTDSLLAQLLFVNGVDLLLVAFSVPLHKCQKRCFSMVRRI